MIDKRSALMKLAYGTRMDIPPALRKQFGGAAFQTKRVHDSTSADSSNGRYGGVTSTPKTMIRRGWDTGRVPEVPYDLGRKGYGSPESDESFRDWFYREKRNEDREQWYQEWLNDLKRKKWAPPNTFIEDERWTTSHPRSVRL